MYVGFARFPTRNARVRFGVGHAVWYGCRGMVGEPGDDGMPMDREAALRRLDALRTEHRELDEAIAGLGKETDEIQLRRLKKRKLALKDAIARVESELVPDLIA